ncbi:MAG: YdiY family protein [Thermoanaerobaculia bacterium]
MKLQTASRISLLVLTMAVPALAQEAAPTKPQCPCPEAPPPPPPLQGSLSAGLSITNGNTDTSAFNLAVNLVYDPKTHGVFKADAFYLRSTSDGEATTDKAAATLRYEYALTERSYAFAQAGYQRDRFKNVVYLFTPMVGGGYYFVKQKDLELSADVSVGGAFEKDSGYDPTNSAAFSLAQAFLWRISPVATFTEKASGLWKTRDVSDSFYHFEMSLAASVTSKSQLKVSYLVDIKNEPNPPTLKKTDTALIAAFVFKF